VLHRLIPNADVFGVGPALLYDADRLCERLGLPVRVVRYAIVAQPVPDAPLLPPRRGRSIAVTAVDPLDPVLTTLELAPAVLAFRSRQQPVCLLARKDGVAIGCLWLNFQAYDEDEVRCRYELVPPGRTAWDYGVYLLPEHRTGLGFARLWDEANALLRSRGIAWSLSRISPFNLASITAHRRLGAVTLGHATFVRLGSGRLGSGRFGGQVMVSTLKPRLHLSCGQDGAPVIAVHAPDR